ncbi:hypothetical protein [Mesonia oceanica]|uniref:Uncharacterized protein n=1 Tax=Mesonia oceanica TaxID=2687242 RepID=A0AC61YC03_9FLAO|nr:hypothetical protein [Mesonia oceanica]MAQ41521.1 hypothetical protein [Mesonia sp.]MBJ96823.1 hypothetical protein [Flavobacteriaceae bacterium]VVV00935.1 hypothetical protein FVB9532_02211 [Mesonia oceanica]|tara:strand:- start:11739 stop:12122 length:384 start_codon:yes stop_codon:yes gene_type:complete
MELKEFIKTTITQISQGIIEAQEEIDGTDMIVNPAGLATNSNGDKYLRTDGWRYVQNIEINVGVTAIEKEGEKAGIGIVTGILSGGAQATSDNSNQTVSTIKFDIPVALPSSPTPKGHKSTRKVSLK